LKRTFSWIEADKCDAQVKIYPGVWFHDITNLKYNDQAAEVEIIFPNHMARTLLSLNKLAIYYAQLYGPLNLILKMG
jgi:plasmid replication initiation protein